MKTIWFDATKTKLRYGGYSAPPTPHNIHLYIGPVYELSKQEIDLIKNKGLSNGIDAIYIISKNEQCINAFHIDNTNNIFWFYKWKKFNSFNPDPQIFDILNELMEK